MPSLGDDLNRRLTEIEHGLTHPAANDLASAARDVEAELEAWAGQASRHHSETEREMKEIIASLARTAESVTARDEKYTVEIGGLTGKFRGIAAMSNLGEIRRSIVQYAAALKTCVERMAEDSRQSVRELSAQVADYRERLIASERLSSLDPLTDLANRRAFESHLQRHIEVGAPFVLILIDLDDFKSVNDRYGHLAGDDLLRQFANELRAQFASTDLVARWGGDEFTVLAAGSVEQAQERMERIRRWALGEYSIQSGEATTKTTLNASMGAAEWNGSETGHALMARADALVYRTKCRPA